MHPEGTWAKQPIYNETQDEYICPELTLEMFTDLHAMN
jgi:hypothetical protein